MKHHHAWYNIIDKIMVIREDGKTYVFSKAYYESLYLNDIEDLYLMKIQRQLKYLKKPIEGMVHLNSNQTSTEIAMGINNATDLSDTLLAESERSVDIDVEIPQAGIQHRLHLKQKLDIYGCGQL
ncbi:hypothetical protein Tco_0067509 [Tanacetum coccineum]